VNIIWDALYYKVLFFVYFFVSSSRVHEALLDFKGNNRDLKVCILEKGTVLYCTVCSQSESEEKYETFGLYVTHSGRGFTRKNRTIIETTMT